MTEAETPNLQDTQLVWGTAGVTTQTRLAPKLTFLTTVPTGRRRQPSPIKSLGPVETLNLESSLTVILHGNDRTTLRETLYLQLTVSPESW